MADWQALGFEQGNQGKGIALFNTYQKDCAKHQIKADFNAFKSGHAQGLQSYCTFDQGLNNGKRGVDYNTHCPRSQFPTFEEGYRSGINRYCSYNNGLIAGADGKDINHNCPSQNYPEFHHGYTIGQQQHQLSQHIEALTKDLDDTQEAMEDTDDHISTAEAIIISETSTPESRKQALEDIKYYKKKYRELDRNYHDQLDTLENAKQEYEAMLQH